MASSLPKGFGSFATPSVEALMALSDDEFAAVRAELIPAELRVDAHTLPVTDSDAPDANSLARAHTLTQPAAADFGTAALRRSLFCIDDEWTFINHGAFGAALRPALACARALSDRCEAQPLRFVDRELLPLLVDATRACAAFVHAPRDELVLVPNVTTALNAVLSSLRASSVINPERGDLVLHFDHVYGSSWRMMLHYFGAAAVRELVVPLPARASQIVAELEAALAAAGGTIKAVIIDHITSNSALTLPVHELVRVCRAHGALSIVDGAHALGALDLDIGALDADFYTSNAHKWLCNAKGCGFLHVPKRNQHLMRALVVSHGSGKGFLSDFVWSGMIDYGSNLALPHVIRFWQRTGVDAVRAYTRDLLAWAIDHLLGAWRTDLLGERDMYTATMCTIRVPGDKARTSNEHQELQDRLHHDYRIECPVKRWNDVLYVRISVHIYNCRADYERLARAILEIRSVSNE